MCSGGGDNKQYNLNLRKAFADTPDSRFEEYIDSRGDLANAWRMIDTYQKGGDMSGFAMHGDMTPEEQAQYWIRKAEGGRFNKADFGRFHAAEDKSLLEGSYPGGTEVRKGTEAHSQYFPEGTTRYDQFTSGGDSGGGGGGGSGPPDWDDPDPPSGTGPYPDDNIYFPMLVPDYEAPRSLDWGRFMPRGQQGANVRPGDIWSGAPDLSGAGGLLYQPWTSNYADRFVPDNLWDYQPPELKVGRPKFYQNPLGILDVVFPEPESSNGNGSNTDGDPGSEEGRDSRYGGDNNSQSHLGWNDVMAALGFNSQGLLGQAGMEVGLADQNAEANAAGGWDSPVG